MGDECKHDEVHQEVLNDTGFWGRKGAGCILVARSTGRILIPRRSPMVLEPCTWGVFGGAIDPSEDEVASVVREVQEEAGKDIDREDLTVLYIFRDENSGFQYTTYLGFVNEEFDPIFNWENDDAKWVTYGDWPSPLHYGLEKIVNDCGAKKKLSSAVMVQPSE